MAHEMSAAPPGAVAPYGPAAHEMPPAARPSRRRPRRGGKRLVTPVTWDLLRISLAGLMLVTISRIHQQYPFLNVFQLGLTLTALALGLAVMRPKSVRWREVAASLPARSVLIFFVLLCAVAPMGLSVGASMNYVLNRFLSTIVFFVLIVVAIRNVGDLRFIVGSYVVSALILIYFGLFVFETVTFGGFARVESTNMYDSNDLGPLLCAALPMALFFAQTSGPRGKWLGYAVAIGVPATIAVTGSRGGFLAIIATGLGLLVMAPGMSFARRIGVVVAAVLAMAVVAPAGYMDKMRSIFDSQTNYNFTEETGRIAIWTRGLGYLAERPLSGVGIGNFARAQWENPTFTETGAQVPAQAPHNTFLQVIVELGIPTFLVFMSIVWMGVVSIARLRGRLPRSWLRESADRRALYLAASYLPVSFLGWAAGAFFVSHAYLAPIYVLAAWAGAVQLLVQRERAKEGVVERAGARAGAQGARAIVSVEPSR
jgi:O-antigen ligase